jgi:diacylglycerol kinase (ATP)
VTRPGRSLAVSWLPCRLDDTGIPVRATFVINPTSGGRQGQALATILAARGDPIHDIRHGRLVELAGACDGVLVACGGDGTAAAVLDAVHRSGRDVPVAVIPLGTGNDLARHLGWPTSSPSAGRLDAWLAHAIAAPERRLDRWLLSSPDGVERAWFNYWSIGDDAAAALRFHHMRRVQPWLMRGGGFNKALYGVCGLIEPGARLRSAVDRTLPSGTGALVVAGVPSYAGGLRLGPEIRSNDGLVDLFALPAGLGLGLLLARQRRARSLGQSTSLQLAFSRQVPMQLDGEPFTAAAGRWSVRHGGQVRVLAGPLAIAAQGVAGTGEAAINQSASAARA